MRGGHNRGDPHARARSGRPRALGPGAQCPSVRHASESRAALSPQILWRWPGSARSGPPRRNPPRSILAIPRRGAPTQGALRVESRTALSFRLPKDAVRREDA
jgi:hypothetical protein